MEKLFEDDDDDDQVAAEKIDQEEGEVDDEEEGEQLEDDDDSGLDDEEDEEEEDDRPRKKQRKQKTRNIFIDDLARVDDDEEDEEDEDAEDGFEYVADEGADVEQSYRDQARYRKLDKQRLIGEEEDAQVIAARLKERYGKSAAMGAFRGDMEHVPQNVLIPSVTDPKLWMVKCKPGSEKAIIFNLTRKSIVMENGNAPLQLLSCFCRDSLKGYIYLEAERQAHVAQAIERMNNIYGSKLHLVPVGEMVDCLKVKAKEVEVKINMWVRIKRGKYGGDLAQVLDVAESGETCTVKLIPRLDYSRDAGAKRKKGAPEIRQPPKLFNPNDVNKREVTTQQGGYMFQGELFDKDGYLEKSMKMTSIEHKNVAPTLEEISKFSGGAVADHGDDLNLLANSNVAKAEDFQTGEKVTVLAGEMRNVEGVVHSVENGVVTIIPDASYGLKNNVQYAAADLAKRFVDGDHVKVINGVHKDEAGLVLKVENNIVTILSDSTLKPIDVFSKDLRSASDVTSITPSTSQYDLHDLVQLSPNELGVIVKMEKDAFTLLDPFGSIIKVKPQQIRNRRDSARAVTSDLNGRPITAKDTVMVMDENGANRRQSQVLHIYRTFVYCHSRDFNENGGVFVTKNSNVALMTAQGNGSNQMYNNQARMVTAPTSRRGYNSFKDPLMGKTVTINGGPFKGYLGIVKDVSETQARVELHTNSRTVTFEKDKLTVKGEEGVQRRPNYQASRPQNRYDTRTPMHTGSRTPAWDAGSKTPAWDSGSKTPAWDAGSKTPAWDAGSKTPAWESSARTPAAFGRPTPRAPTTPGNVPTPYQSGPTPGSTYPTTPGVSNTPYLGGRAQTPATPYDPATVNHPQTPAGGMGSNDYGRARDSTGKGSWITVDIEVRVSSNRRFSSGKLDGQDGVIKQVDGNRAQIHLLSTGESILIAEEFLVPVAPQKKDSFKVLSGEDRGKIGTLLSIDGHEGVVKIEGVDDILMMNLDTLAKLAA